MNKIPHLMYWLYGFSIVGSATVAELRGVSFNSINERKTDPRSIRNNPGAYRPIYGNSPRYTGGK